MIRLLTNQRPTLTALPERDGMKFQITLGSQLTSERIFTNSEPNIQEYGDQFSVPKNLVGTGLFQDLINHKKAKHGLPEEWEFDSIWDEGDHHYMKLRWYIIRID